MSVGVMKICPANRGRRGQPRLPVGIAGHRDREKRILLQDSVEVTLGGRFAELGSWRFLLSSHFKG